MKTRVSVFVSLGAAVTAAGLKIIKLANSFAVQNFARDFKALLPIS